MGDSDRAVLRSAKCLSATINEGTISEATSQHYTIPRKTAIPSKWIPIPVRRAALLREAHFMSIDGAVCYNRPQARAMKSSRLFMLATSTGLCLCYGSQFAGTWRNEDATCVIRESGQQVSVHCEYKTDHRQQRAVETGTLGKGPVLRTTAIDADRKQISISRVLAPDGVSLYERRQAQDVPDEPVLELLRTCP
jgi:hypothetical protein